VTSWAKSTAWGFISCPDLQAYFAKDIFFHQKDCGGSNIVKGQKVTFMLDDVAGKPQARFVRPVGNLPDPADEIRYDGTVASFSVASAWGFISCPVLQATFNKDVFFHLKDCGGLASVERGQAVTFLLDATANPAKPQARSVRVLVEPGMSPEARYRGTVTNFSQNTAWGFIACPELNQVYGKDVFFHQKDAPGQTVANGAVVTFTLDNTDSTKPQARQVRLEGGAGGLSSSSIEGAIQNVLSSIGTGGQQQHQPQQLQAFGQPTQQPVRAVDGSVTYSGHVQSFSSQAGWGFLECAALAATLGLPPGKGLFFHTKDFVGLPGVAPNKGDPVTFALGQGPSGKPQGVQVVLQGVQAGAMGAFSAVAPPNMDFGQAAPAASAWAAVGLQQQDYGAVQAPAQALGGGAGAGVLSEADLQRAIAMALEGPSKRQRLI